MERFVDAESTERSTTLRRRGMLSWLDSWTVHQSYDLSGELDRGRNVELRNPLQDVRLVRLAAEGAGARDGIAAHQRAAPPQVRVRIIAARSGHGTDDGDRVRVGAGP